MGNKNISPGIQPFFHELLSEHNFSSVAGVDEAGRGACAGPLVAAACVFSLANYMDESLQGVNDSKKLSARQREKMFPLICEQALTYSIVEISSHTIDSVGVHEANNMGIRMAINQLSIEPDFVFVDGLHVPGITIPSLTVPQGDARVLAIAAASILAKVTRDNIMTHYDTTYPGYGFARHKGYGTQFHQQALQQLGASAIHRKSYANVRPFIK